ncbi:hypothetical protein S83_053521, partial [Arachis hypogaea]
LIPTCVLLLGLFIISDSPRWLAKRGRGKEFQAALRTLRGKDTDISQVANEIQVPICFNKNSVTLLIFKDYAIFKRVCIIATQDYITSLEQLPKPKLLKFMIGMLNKLLEAKK